jgi:tRNAThr (cytosine32-N3)-methyltransferase
LANVEEALKRQRAAPVPTTDHFKYNEKPWQHWDTFYRTNTNNFFKDRKWLSLEFPELAEATARDKGAVSILEVGCGMLKLALIYFYNDRNLRLLGAGNTIFPLIRTNENPDLSIYACDYSHRAISLVQSNPLYSSHPPCTVRAATWDLTSHDLPEGVTAGSVDILIMIFVLSALHPTEWRQAVQNASRVRNQWFQDSTRL